MRRLLLVLILIATASCELHAQTSAGQLRLVGNTHYISVEYSTGKFRWEVLDTKEVADGGTLRISKDGTRTGYQPTEYTGRAAYTALRSAMAAAVDGDLIIPDSKIVHERDGNALILSGLSNVTVGPFRVTRDPTETYTRVVQFINCNNCELIGCNADMQGGTFFDTTWPLTVNSVGAANPNAVAITYVIELLTCTGCKVTDCSVKDHPGTPTLSSSGFPHMPSTYGIHINGGFANVIDGGIFDKCGYSAVSDQGNGTIIRNVLESNSGWHALRIAGTNTGTTVVENWTTIGSYRAQGPRSTVDINTVGKDSVTFTNCTFQHNFDWAEDMQDWSVSETYTAGEIVIAGAPSKMYRAVAGGTGGSEPVHTTGTVGDWEHLQLFTSAYQFKAGGCKKVSFIGCNWISGELGDPLFSRANIRYENNSGEGVGEMEFIGCNLSGGISSQDAAEKCRISFDDTRLGLTQGGYYGVRASMQSVSIKGSQLGYGLRCFHDTSGGFAGSFSSTESRFIPSRINYVHSSIDGTDTEIVHQDHIAAIGPNIDFDDSNVIVDNTDDSESRHGTANHKLAPTADSRLWMSGDAKTKYYDASLTGNQAHPTQTGLILNASTGLADKSIEIKNVAWTGGTDVLSSWRYNGTGWIPNDRIPHHVVCGGGDTTPDVTFATSCETPGDGTTLTTLDWSTTIPTGWEMTISIKPTDGLDAGTAPQFDFGEFGSGPTDPWLPIGGGNARVRWNGVNWVLVDYQESSTPTGIRETATNDTPTQTDRSVNVDATSGPLTVILDTSLAIGTRFEIKKIDSTGNAVTLDPTGGTLIDGSTTATITSQNDSLTVAWDGTDWWIY